jgi:hypothetical protein
MSSDTSSLTTFLRRRNGLQVGARRCPDTASNTLCAGFWTKLDKNQVVLKYLYRPPKTVGCHICSCQACSVGSVPHSLIRHALSVSTYQYRESISVRSPEATVLKMRRSWAEKDPRKSGVRCHVLARRHIARSQVAMDTPSTTNGQLRGPNESNATLQTDGSAPVNVLVCTVEDLIRSNNMTGARWYFPEHCSCHQ